MGTGNPALVSVPLSAEVRAAYQATHDQADLAMQKTANTALLLSLDDTRLNAAAVISRDNEYRINANDATYQALTAQISKTNDSMKNLLAQIAGIANTIKEVADVADGIAAALAMAPKI